MQSWVKNMACTFHHLNSHSYSYRFDDLILGDISSITMLGTCYIILNSSKAISVILKKQNIKCSNRLHLTMVSDLVGLSKEMVFMNYNDRFHQSCKLTSCLFGTRNSTAAFNLIKEEETRRFLHKVHLVCLTT